MKEIFDGERLQAIERMMQYYRVPGLVFAVFRGDGEPEMHCLGEKNAEAKTGMDPSTRFCMASISKSFTAAVVSKLCDEGKLDLDRPVTDFVPELRYREKQMTLKDMMSHRSGLANHDALWPGDKSRAEVARQMRYLDSNLAFRSKYQYNNTQFVMAGYAAEAVTGRTFEKLLEEYFLEPLGMTETSATEAGIKACGNMAEPYRVFGTTRRRLPFWNMDLAVPAAGVNSSLNDMVKWVRFHMAGGVTKEGERLLSEKAFREMHTPHIGIDAEPVVAGDPLVLEGYGLGWRMGTYRGTPFQMHSGKIEGYSSTQIYLPEKDTGFVIMMNLHDPELVLFHGIMYDALDEAAFGIRSSWLSRFSAEMGLIGEHAGYEAYRELFADYTTPEYKGTDQKQTSGEAHEKEHADLSGTYQNPGYGELMVYKEAGTWMLHYRDQDLPLLPVSGNRFVMDGVKEDIWILRVPVEFAAGGEGGYEVLVKYDESLPPVRFS